MCEAARCEAARRYGVITELHDVTVTTSPLGSIVRSACDYFNMIGAANFRPEYS